MSADLALGATDSRLSAKGKQLKRDIALELALGKRRHDAGDVRHCHTTLGRREADVAELVTDGLSNKQIGARLFISERTVDNHVRNILNKLGFNSRPDRRLDDITG